jgi:hypothetical protein
MLTIFSLALSHTHCTWQSYVICVEFIGQSRSSLATCVYDALQLGNGFRASLAHSGVDALVIVKIDFGQVFECTECHYDSRQPIVLQVERLQQRTIAEDSITIEFLDEIRVESEMLQARCMSEQIHRHCLQSIAIDSEGEE